MRRSAVLLSACLALAAAEARAQGDEVATAIARDLADRYIAACAAGDALAVADLYSDDAFAVHPTEDAVAAGRAELEKLLAASCAKDSGVTLELQSLRARFVDTTVIVTLGRWKQRATGPAGGKPVETVLRTTEVLVKGETGWRYASDHASLGAPPPVPALRSSR
jgi:uncharacterized protein (TIGR02246 family)